MNESTDLFYFRNKSFPTFDAMVEYEKIWQKQKLDEETAQELLNMLNKDIILNLSVREFPFTNSEFCLCVERLFHEFMNTLGDKEYHIDKTAP